MDISFKYTVDEVEQITDYTNVLVTIDFTIPQVTLTFPQLSGTNYDTLYNDMENSPTEIEVKFTGFGEEVSYSTLNVTNVSYHKTLNSDLVEFYDMTITLQQ